MAYLSSPCCPSFDPLVCCTQTARDIDTKSQRNPTKAKNEVQNQNALLNKATEGTGKFFFWEGCTVPDRRSIEMFKL